MRRVGAAAQQAAAPAIQSAAAPVIPAALAPSVDANDEGSADAVMGGCDQPLDCLKSRYSSSPIPHRFTVYSASEVLTLESMGVRARLVGAAAPAPAHASAVRRDPNSAAVVASSTPTTTSRAPATPKPTSRRPASSGLASLAAPGAEVDSDALVGEFITPHFKMQSTASRPLVIPSQSTTTLRRSNLRHSGFACDASAQPSPQPLALPFESVIRTTLPLLSAEQGLQLKRREAIAPARLWKVRAWLPPRG